MTLRRIALAFVLLSRCHCAVASNTTLDVSQYSHAAWTVGEGFAKGAIYSIAQTPDGYLWLGTEFGLLRFDGVTTTPWPPEHPIVNEVTTLVAGRDGTLWIGMTGTAALASWKDGHLTRHIEADGRLISLLEDRSGAIWFIRPLPDRRLCAIQIGSLQCMTRDSRFGSRITAMYADQKGSVWFAEPAGVWQWDGGQPTFYPVEKAETVQALSEDADGLLLIMESGRIDRMVDGRFEPAYTLPRTQTPATKVLRDRDGGLWIGSLGGGLTHLHDGRLDQFSRADGLTSDSVGDLLQDREGNIWVGTHGGLDRFRATPGVRFTGRQGFSNLQVTSVLAAKDGSVWVRTLDGLNHWDNGRVTVFHNIPDLAGSTSQGPPPARLGAATFGNNLVQGGGSLFEDERGRIWVSGRPLGYVEHNRFVTASGVPGGIVFAMTGDLKGNMWLAYARAGLVRVSADRVVETIPWERLGRTIYARALAVDPVTGGLWMGFLNGGIDLLEDGHVTASYGAKEGLLGRNVNDLRIGQGGALWVSTGAGLHRIKDGRVIAMTSRDGLPCNAAIWTMEDDRGDLWLSMRCGLVRIARSDLETWEHRTEANGPRSGPIPVSVFDSSDGVRPRFYEGPFSPRVAKTSDGKLWFFPLEGLVAIDPGHLSRQPLPPLVHIEHIDADHQGFPVPQAGTLRLPARSRDIEIGYTGLSFSNPQGVKFQYLLEGYDNGWQEVGNRRQAFYTNLRPGSYRFRVMARNDNGAWTDADTAFDFSIAPAYYQTVWFAMLSITTVIVAVWGTYRLRLHGVEKHQQEISALNQQLMKTQEQERIRLAGELHDGVMQEMLAVTMMLGTAKRRMEDESPAKVTMDRIQERMVRVGTDLRRLSHDLHPPLLQESGLPGAVRAYCEEFSTATGIPVSCEVDDSARDLSRGAALALFRIVQEALGNVAKHAKATRISVRVARADDTVSMMVSDNGIGFERSGQARGGLGLITMRERTNQLNGEFDVESTPGRGTTIRVSIPFR